MPPDPSFDHLPAFMRRRVAQSDVVLTDTSSAIATPTEPLSYPHSEASTSHAGSASASALQSRVQSPQLLPADLLQSLPEGATIAPDGTVIPPAPTDAELAEKKREPATKRLRYIDDKTGFILVDAEEYMKLKKAREPEPWTWPGPFRFFDLPAELRLQILRHHLLLEETVDLNPANVKSIAPRLAILLTGKRLHEEAAAVFYGENTFRLFPTHGRFFLTKKVLLQRMSKRCKELICNVELRLGPGWSQPPKTWNLGPKMGIPDLATLRTLKIFVECDPSSDIFKGFRVNDSFYTLFSCELLTQMKKQAPWLKVAEFDGYSSVKRNSSLMSNLIATAEGSGLRITWTPGGRWDGGKDLADAFSELALADQSCIGDPCT